MTPLLAWILSAAGLCTLYARARRDASAPSALLACAAVLGGALFVLSPGLREAALFAASAIALDAVERPAFRRIPALRIGVCVAGALAVAATLVSRHGRDMFEDVLFCSEHGALATLPVLWCGAAGLCWRGVRAPRIHAATLSIAALCLAIAIREHHASDTWRASIGSFVIVMPALAIGLAWLLDDLSRAVRRHPLAAAAAFAAPLVVWNLTLMAAGQTGALPIGDPVSFGDVGANQARTLHDWIGHPFAFPANAIFALRQGLPIARFDALGVPHLDVQPIVIQVGAHDEGFLRDGWYGPETAAGAPFRWASGRARLYVPEVPGGRLRMTVALTPYGLAPGQSEDVSLEIDEVPAGRATLRDGDRSLTMDLASPALSRGVSTIAIVFPAATSPQAIGAGGDRRVLGANVRQIQLSAADR